MRRSPTDRKVCSLTCSSIRLCARSGGGRGVCGAGAAAGRPIVARCCATRCARFCSAIMNSPFTSPRLAGAAAAAAAAAVVD